MQVEEPSSPSIQPQAARRISLPPLSTLVHEAHGQATSSTPSFVLVSEANVAGKHAWAGLLVAGERGAMYAVLDPYWLCRMLHVCHLALCPTYLGSLRLRHIIT